MQSAKLIPLNIFWFRRDLRIGDNTGLAHASHQELPVLPIFIFDTNILDKLQARDDARVTFIHQQVQHLRQNFLERGSDLKVFMGKPLDIFKKLMQQYDVHTVFCNNDYEPYARKRDGEVSNYLQQQGSSWQSFKDQVIFEKSEVVKADGKPYTVYTPYMRRWKENFQESGGVEALEKLEIGGNLLPQHPVEIPSLQQIGFRKNQYIEFPDKQVADVLLRKYQQKRDYPAEAGTSRLGIHLRFGTISLRSLVKHAWKFSETYLNELIWREFYMMILWHFPKVVDEPFNPAYRHIPWRNDPGEFEKWCQGQTGYPIVDAGMRELNATGYMHNRVRMITASFLTKHLLIDWRWGEAYFAEKLLDFELASNNGGWQWAAGTGCDAAPYFRVFNPALQAKKFDPLLQYIKKWVPELDEPEYPPPLVDHAKARKRALDTYKETLNAVNS